MQTQFQKRCTGCAEKDDTTSIIFVAKSKCAKQFTVWMLLNVILMVFYQKLREINFFTAIFAVYSDFTKFFTNQEICQLTTM